MSPHHATHTNNFKSFFTPNFYKLRTLTIHTHSLCLPLPLKIPFASSVSESDSDKVIVSSSSPPLNEAEWISQARKLSAVNVLRLAQQSDWCVSQSHYGELK